MPRFYFSSSDGRTLLQDHDGIDLRGIEQARALGVRALTEMARDVLPNASAPCVLKIVVDDEGKRPLLELSLTFGSVDCKKAHKES